MEMHEMKTVESGQYCAKEEILKAKMGSDTYRNSGNTSREFNFVTAGELTVTITLDEYRELITGKEQLRKQSLDLSIENWRLKDELDKAKKKIDALQSIVRNSNSQVFVKISDEQDD